MTLSDALLLVAIVAAVPETPGDLTISGPATVIDGDTIDLASAGRRIRVRLFGIDAPESEQRCFDAGKLPYKCGQLAADALEEEIGGAVVSCFTIDTDKYGRTVAVCTARGNDLARRMVERGWAVDYAYFSGGRYGEAEKEAEAARRGMWVGTFTRPQIWRWEHRR